MGVLKDILSISGQGGLFKFISQGRNGIIVEDLTNGKRMHSHATAKISALDDIAIYTEEEEMPLEKVFKKIHDLYEGKQVDISSKANPEELKSFFEKVLSDYDKSRVYVSDIKKIIKWYNLLCSLDMLKFEEEKKEDEEEKKEVNEKSEKQPNPVKKEAKKKEPQKQPANKSGKKTNEKGKESPSK